MLPRRHQSAEHHGAIAPCSPATPDRSSDAPAHHHIQARRPLRPPLISVADIEQRLVFTKFTQPFRLNDGKRQWVFGGELYKFEGRHLKQYWAMLFTDLLLFTKINRDRVIFVMEDPVPLASVCQAIFNVKKKATEFRLIVDIGVRVPGSEAGYLNSPSTTRRRRGSTTSTSSSGRANKRTLVIRAPTIDLKATWNNLINRQLYECQLGASSPLSDYGTSLARAASTDGVPAISPASSRFSSSVGDLRRGGGQEEGVLVVDLGQGRARGPPAASSSSTSCFKSRKLQIRQGEVEEELELADEDDEYSAPLRPSSAPVSPPISAPVSAPVSPPTTAPRVKLTPATPPEFQFVVEHDDPRTAPRSIKPSKAAKVKRGKGGGGRTGGGGRSGGGGRKRGSRPGRSGGGGIVTGPVEEVILNLDSEQPTAAAPLVRGASGDNSALANHHPEDAEVFEDEENEEQYDDEDDEDDGIVIEDDKTGLKSRLAPKKTLGGKVKDKLFPNRHLPKVKKMDRAKKVEKYVDSLVVEDLNHRGRVTPVLPGEDRLTHEDFTRTRNRILQTRPKNFHEGAEEIITLESPPPPRRTEVDLRAEQGARRSEMRLEGIDDVPQRPPVLAQDSFTAPATVLSPEDYEDYIGEPVEKDYPELAGPVEPPRPATPVSPPPSLPPQDSFDYAPQEPVAPEPEEIPQYYSEEPPPAPEPAPLAVEETTPSGPLSGSASMNFMDDHSPTNGNGDFYRRCVARCPRQPPRPACGSFSLASSSSPVTTPSGCSRGLPRSPPIHLLNNNESINSFASHFRTSCVASSDLVSGGEKRPKRTVSVSSSSANDSSRNNSTSASEHSSMSISSASSSVSNVNKNRTKLFLPTSTTSLPEISVEPPTPQAPKPKDVIDRENKIKYDLLVPGYRSMFLTVPGVDDDCSDRFLPKYSLDSDDDDDSSSEEDDDVVHKPKVLGSLTGLAEGRGLKRYGSSCDIAKLAKGFPEEEAYQQYTQNDYCDDDYNGNFNANHRMSKVGGTGSGPFVAGKLAMFEKVVEEEHQKFIEGQEVRKRIFRAPRKSGEYIEKFYSPQVISSVDARAIDRNQSPPYEDEYDNLDHSRPCTPRDVETPYGGHTSPRRTSTSNYTYRSSDSSNVYTSKPSSPLPRATSPPTKPISPPLTSRLSSPRARSPSPVAKSPSPVARSPSPSGRSSSPSARAPSAAASSNYHDDYDLYPERPMSPTSTLYKAETRQVTPAHGGIRLGSGSEPRTSPDAGRQRLGYQESLEQRTDEVLEMLDMSYLDEAPAPSRHSRSSASPPPAARGREEVTRSSASRSPPPDLSFDQLDDVFDIEEEDVMGSTTSLGQKKRSAPRPPTPPHGAAASPPAEGKLGAFFKGKLGKDSSAPKEKKEKKKDKKDKGKDKEKKEKVKKEEKGATGGAAGGKRFQLFGGAKKASEPQSPTQDSPQASPKKDKGGGKRRLFGRGKENFLGRSPQVQQTSDPQVARMTGGSFDQESISFEDDEYI
ncbi:uncharacterized protein LOC135112587 isoform X1 [Scylla paramamosain]|uniref:uncharacterized protein LOC135112587 isoform X1 n=1 Tax=Scylla paramamosain TaxID=85552 RepID=UPI0030836CC2